LGWRERKIWKIVDITATTMQIEVEMWELISCTQDVIICNTLFENAPNHAVAIGEMRISGDCLTIKVGTSGCTGSGWVVKLIDSDVVYYSDDTGFPPQPPTRTLRFSLEHIGICAAAFQNEFSFYIRDLQVSGHNKVWLDVSGLWTNFPSGLTHEGRILYEY